MSASGWVALGLKSAKAAYLPALQTDRADKMFELYKEHIDQRTTVPETGIGKYHAGEKAWRGPLGLMDQHMAWVGMFNKQFLGFPRSDRFLTKAAENTIGWVKTGTWVGQDVPGDVYGIYYGTLAAFQRQGQMWYVWNEAMKHTLLTAQLKGDPKLLGGSWNPTPGQVGEHGGRVYTTALMALCLEVYYRYELIN